MRVKTVVGVGPRYKSVVFHPDHPDHPDGEKQAVETPPFSVKSVSVE
jgi:hypothetical protein